MSPLSAANVLNRQHFSQLGDRWQSLVNNEILHFIIDVMTLVSYDRNCI